MNGLSCILAAAVIFLLFWMAFRPLNKVDDGILSGSDRESCPWEEVA